jgi:hypothetical protein
LFWRLLPRSGYLDRPLSQKLQDIFVRLDNKLADFSLLRGEPAKLLGQNGKCGDRRDFCPISSAHIIGKDGDGLGILDADLLGDGRL